MSGAFHFPLYLGLLMVGIFHSPQPGAVWQAGFGTWGASHSPSISSSLEKRKILLLASKTQLYFLIGRKNKRKCRSQFSQLLPLIDMSNSTALSVTTFSDFHVYCLNILFYSEQIKRSRSQHVYTVTLHFHCSVSTVQPLRWKKEAPNAATVTF